ncbi:hypothetical protein F5X98DRAFT_326871 [Xylaria grammica]|nr:hypothetical protein F5X98DRAFT_326871 [Xylaria grammica]
MHICLYLVQHIIALTSLCLISISNQTSLHKNYPYLDSLGITSCWTGCKTIEHHKISNSPASSGIGRTNYKAGTSLVGLASHRGAGRVFPVTFPVTTVEQASSIVP